MGAFSTLIVSRDKAKAHLAQALTRDLSDETLERLLDVVLEPRLYNARVTSGDGDDDNLL